MSAARRSSSTARRSLLTTTAAGTLLGALWFVPSANATQDSPEQQTSTTAPTAPTAPTASDTEAEAEAEAEAGTDADAAGPHTRLADTGSFDTTPYVVGGTFFLSLGAGFVAYSVRRERTTTY